VKTPELPSLPAKFRPWEREKLLGKKAPHPVDERWGFCDSLQWRTPIGWNPMAVGGDFDRLRKGRVEDGRRYLGDGGWQRINTYIP
jgi:hypothetical protein